MTIGVPKEIKDHENRVALTPRSVASLVSSGIKVAVERNAGAKSGFSDADYASAGAQVASDAAELYSKADLVVKVKEIQVGKGEHAHILQKHIIFGYNHFESSRELTSAAIRSGATFISFEKVTDGNGQTPLLMPMSRIAGTLAGIWAGFFHNYAFRHDKSLRMKAGADQVKARFIEDFERIIDGKLDAATANSLSLHDKQVVIFGGGTAGEMASRTCHALGAKLTIVEKRDSRRKYLQGLGLGRCSVVASADYDAIKGASAVIGATYDKEKADRMIDEMTLKNASEVRKKVIIDISIDQGGNFPFVDSTGKYAPESMGTIMSPAQMDYFGNVFVRVPNMPSIVPRYASMALSNAITDHVKAIATNQTRPELVRATSIAGGKVLDEAVARAHSLPYAKTF
ncbi:alanine dehydrogenase [Candidatus Nitrososphaera evergladensis SR1]|uniref:Alanine dehydrogenase n=1 Tax=Candidatus Nitrososphaera evergladensis SR1 TaxID=1459636 RepID=A0A075MV55_9ARCH|nr:NAD(P)-dependent oxidoreductase [Candidatus Nitrososphaera evergladensis]AIF84537.1 alanine dehydrogenase [Candidatus Nitrososphaera evergladensis SR1]